MSDIHHDHDLAHPSGDLGWLYCLLQTGHLNVRLKIERVWRLVEAGDDGWQLEAPPSGGPTPPLETAFEDGSPEVLVYRNDRMIARADSALLAGLSGEAVIEPLPGLVQDDGRPAGYVVVAPEDPFRLIERVDAPTGTLAPDADLALDELALIHAFSYFSHSSWLAHSTWLDGDHEMVRSTTGDGRTPIDPGAISGAQTPKIGVIDSGVDTQHPWHRRDVAGNLEPEQPEGEDPHSVVYGHGTGVCGVIRQGAPNSEIWVRRPAPNDCWYLEELDIIRLINDMSSEDVQILNLSFGGATVGQGTALRVVLALFALQSADHHVIAAAGNRDEPADPMAPIFPAAWPEVTAVAGGTPGGPATGATAYYDWSNGDEKADGIDWVDEVVEVDDYVLSDGATTAQVIWTSYPGNRYAAWQGTSFLAPIVAAEKAGGDNPHALDRV